MNILLAGGAGYIASHTAVSLLEAGHTISVVDNYCNSSPEATRRVEKITGKLVRSHRADVRDRKAMEEILRGDRIECVIHFAGLKAVGESVAKPLEYYRNNLDSTLSLMEAMRSAGVHSIVFSSSATVYGETNPVPNSESQPKGMCTNPYGWTKWMIEQILKDASAADPLLSVVLLRYFNPIGAHPSGLIGEDPQGIPNNLMPYVAQVAVGRRDHLTIFGNDYATPDGTCRRDFIHVMDLAQGHLKAVEYAAAHRGCDVFNLGTGRPYSVLEIVHAFEKACGFAIKHEFGARRAGDLPECYADPSKAREVLGWSAQYGIEDMCRDTWNWQKRNPRGYEI